MIKNHFKIAWRNLSKDKVFSCIKIGGFAIGIAACLLIALFIRDELSYDRHYKNTDRIYRVVMQGVMDGEVVKSVHFQLPFADALKSHFPEIQKAGKMNMSELFGAGSRSMRRTGEIQNNIEEGFVFANQELFDILEIPLEEGSAHNALASPQSIVISKSKANIYFPDGKTVGKTVVLDNNTDSP